VKNLILQAYYAYSDGQNHPPPFPPIEGGPSWIESARYTIDATTDSPVTHGTMNGPMLQALLEERFHLRLRRETREGAAYALTVAKGGPKLKPYQPGDCLDIGRVKPLTGPAPHIPRGERPVICGANQQHPRDPSLMVLDVPGVSLDYFCKVFLAIAFWDRPVINRTGLDGLYDIHLEFAPDDATPGPPATPRPPDSAADAAPRAGLTIFSAIHQQLGLRLEPAKGPREFLVIDSIQRPSEN